MATLEHSSPTREYSREFTTSFNAMNSGVSVSGNKHNYNHYLTKKIVKTSENEENRLKRQENNSLQSFVIYWTIYIQIKDLDRTLWELGIKPILAC